VGLVILEPAEGATVSEQTITIRGLTQPGATITHDIPFAFDEHTVADANGAWSFHEQLSPGQNVFKFRVGDDSSTAQTLTVYYTPN
jgi:hypothetical protein